MLQYGGGLFGLIAAGAVPWIPFLVLVNKRSHINSAQQAEHPSRRRQRAPFLRALAACACPSYRLLRAGQQGAWRTDFTRFHSSREQQSDDQLRAAERCAAESIRAMISKEHTRTNSER